MGEGVWVGGIRERVEGEKVPYGDRVEREGEGERKRKGKGRREEKERK